MKTLWFLVKELKNSWYYDFLVVYSHECIFWIFDVLSSQMHKTQMLGRTDKKISLNLSIINYVATTT